MAKWCLLCLPIVAVLLVVLSMSPGEARGAKVSVVADTPPEGAWAYWERLWASGLSSRLPRTSWFRWLPG